MILKGTKVFFSKVCTNNMYQLMIVASDLSYSLAGCSIGPTWYY
jgi:hypothetical protein